MFNKQGKLDIFENFRRDLDLPKFNQDARFQGVLTIPNSGTNVVLEPNSFTPQIVVGGSGGTRRWRSSDFTTGNDQSVGRKLPFTKRIVAGIADFLTRLIEVPPTQRLTVQEFFASVKNSTEELAIINERAAGYELQIKKAMQSGQRALVEKLTFGLAGVRAEAQLVALDYKKHITEESLVDFAKRCKRGLRLDWVANFTRVIPDDVLEKKKAADERLIFDNYVVLHYDPDTKAYSETKAEKDAKKDPILFGVMEGTRKLYFIGDWVDEFCDLTLDQIADTIGKDAIKEIQ